MQTDFPRFKRRPFLVPLLMPVTLLALVIAAAIWLLDARLSTVLILVRHAEIEQSNSANARLSAEGAVRAANLQRLLAQAKPARGVDVIYVSEDPASQQTAATVAESMGLAVNVVPAAEWDVLPGFIGRNHAGEVALIVGTRAALLSILKSATATDFTVADDDYSSVFVISRSRLSKASVVRLRY
ncbi:MAG: histidine phosphatase family protein [Steroidobacteraceae bacterium]